MIKMMHPSNVMTDHKKGFAIGGRKTWSFPSYRLQLFQHWGWYQQGHRSLTRYRYLTLMTLLMVSFVNIQVRGWSSQAWCLSGKFPPGEKWTFMVSNHHHIGNLQKPHFQVFLSVQSNDEPDPKVWSPTWNVCWYQWKPSVWLCSQYQRDQQGDLFPLWIILKSDRKRKEEYVYFHLLRTFQK